MQLLQKKVDGEAEKNQANKEKSEEELKKQILLLKDSLNQHIEKSERSQLTLTEELHKKVEIINQKLGDCAIKKDITNCEERLNSLIETKMKQLNKDLMQKINEVQKQAVSIKKEKDDEINDFKKKIKDIDFKKYTDGKIQELSVIIQKLQKDRQEALNRIQEQFQEKINEISNAKKLSKQDKEDLMDECSQELKSEVTSLKNKINKQIEEISENYEQFKKKSEKLYQKSENEVEEIKDEAKKNAAKIEELFNKKLIEINALQEGKIKQLQKENAIIIEKYIQENKAKDDIKIKKIEGVDQEIAKVIALYEKEIKPKLLKLDESCSVLQGVMNEKMGRYDEDLKTQRQLLESISKIPLKVRNVCNAGVNVILGEKQFNSIQIGTEDIKHEIEIQTEIDPDTNTHKETHLIGLLFQHEQTDMIAKDSPTYYLESPEKNIQEYESEEKQSERYIPPLLLRVKNPMVIPVHDEVEMKKINLKKSGYGSPTYLWQDPQEKNITKKCSAAKNKNLEAAVVDIPKLKPEEKMKPTFSQVINYREINFEKYIPNIEEKKQPNDQFEDARVVVPKMENINIQLKKIPEKAKEEGAESQIVDFSLEHQSPRMNYEGNMNSPNMEIASKDFSYEDAVSEDGKQEIKEIKNMLTMKEHRVTSSAKLEEPKQDNSFDLDK